MSRKYTNKILEMMDAGIITPTWLAEALASWCSEPDIKEFYEKFLQEFDEDGIEEEKEEEDENDYSRRELRNRRED